MYCWLTISDTSWRYFLCVHMLKMFSKWNFHSKKYELVFFYFLILLFYSLIHLFWRAELVHLALYNLIQENPSKEFFRWREDICKWINQNWDILTPTKTRTPTWENTVASVLCTNRERWLHFFFFFSTKTKKENFKTKK